MTNLAYNHNLFNQPPVTRPDLEELKFGFSREKTQRRLRGLLNFGRGIIDRIRGVNRNQIADIAG